MLFLAKEIEKRLADLKRGHLFSPRMNQPSHSYGLASTNKHEFQET
jgi:hypothetical protein